MIGVIFTKNKVIVAHNSPERPLTPTQIIDPIPLDANIQTALETNVRQLLKSYRKVENRLLAYQGKIPLIVIYSHDFEKKKGQEIIGALCESVYSLKQIRSIDLTEAYIYGMRADLEFNKANYLILKSDDKGVFAHFYEGSNTLNKLQHQRIKKIGLEAGREAVLDLVIGEMAKNGVIIDPNEELDLIQQVNEFKGGNEFLILKKSGFLNVKISYTMPLPRFQELTACNHEVLKPILRETFDNKKDYKNLILIGKYFANHIVKNYICRELRLEDKVIYETDGEDQEYFSTILKGAFKLAKRSLDLEYFAFLKKEKLRKTERLKLFAQISEICKVSEKQIKYEQRFGAKAKKIGLPKNVLTWKIREAIKNHNLNKEWENVQANIPPNPKIQKNGFEVNNTLHFFEKPQKKVNGSKALDFLPSKESNTPKDPEITQNYTRNTVPPLKKLQHSKKERIQHWLQDKCFIEHWFDGYDYGCCLASFRQEKGTIVLRTLHPDKADNQSNLDGFHELYRQEASYYPHISPIQNWKGGKYYFRKTISGLLLSEYFNKENMKKNGRLKELTNNDLKVIDAVWNEINGLNFACKNLQSDNILIHSKTKWNFKKDFQVVLIGLHASNYPKAKMYEDVHTLFEKLLGDQVYNRLREHIKNIVPHD